MKNGDTIKHRTRRSNSKAYAVVRDESKRVNDRKMTKEIKQLSHRMLRKMLKAELKRETEEWNRERIGSIE